MNSSARSAPASPGDGDDHPPGEHGHSQAGHSHGRGAIVAALFANLGIAVAKLVGFLITRSSSLLAETGHSIADSGNQALLLLGARRAKREANDRHPFGYGRERFFWAFVVALVLFMLGSIFAIYEGVSKLQHPHALDSPIVAIIILVVAIGLEGFSFRTAVKEARPLKGSQSWGSFIRTAKNPELPVVLLEDFGALAGLVLALAGVGMVEITDNARWDAVSTLGIGGLLGIIAIVLAVEMKSLLIGESGSAEDTHNIREAIASSPGVKRLIHFRTLHLGPEELLVTGKIDLDPGLSFADIAQAINEAEDRVRAAVPIARVIYLEPDRYDPRRSPTPDNVDDDS